MEYLRASATKVVDRATSEFRAQKPLFDVILVHDAEMRLLLKNNVISRYNSPAFKDFTKESIDADLGPRYRDTIIGIVYNKTMINPEDAPKSMKDLLQPRFEESWSCRTRLSIRRSSVESSLRVRSHIVM